MTWSLELRRGSDAAAARPRAWRRAATPVDDRADRTTRGAAGRSGLAADRPARRQPRLRPDRRRPDARPAPTTAAPGASTRRRFAATSWPAIRTPTASATTASGISTPSRCRPATRGPVDSRRLAAGTLAGGDEAEDEAASWPRTCKSCSTTARPPDAEASRRRALSPARLAGRAAVRRRARTSRSGRPTPSPRTPVSDDWGLDPALFGKHPDGTRHRRGEPVRAGPVGRRGPPAGRPGRRLRVRHDRRARPRHRRRGKRAAAASPTSSPSRWPRCGPTSPVLVDDGSAAREAVRSGLRRLPPLVSRRRSATPKIVPVDEVVTLTLFHREDDQLVPADARRAAEGRSSTGCGTSCTSSARTR